MQGSAVIILYKFNHQEQNKQIKTNPIISFRLRKGDTFCSESDSGIISVKFLLFKF